MGSFETAVREMFTNSDPLSDMYANYMLTTNERGFALVDQMIAYFTGPLEGKRVLDIGSGLGGACVAAYDRGASEAVGIELAETERALSYLNIADHNANIKIVDLDALDTQAVQNLGLFGLVLCDNVVEHVNDAARLIVNIQHALDSDGYYYLSGPNSRSLGQVLSECHYQEFGLSLLDRHDAQRYLTAQGHAGRYCVGDYDTYGDYLRMFERAGLTAVQIIPVDWSLEAESQALDLAREIRTKRAELDQTLPTHVRLAEVLDFYLDRFEQRYAEVVAAGPDPSPLRAEFFRDYMLQLWIFVGKRA